VRFFFDRNIPIRLAKMLDAYDAGNIVLHHDQDPRFDEDSADTDIISEISQDKPRPIFITADVNMYTKNPNERIALANSGLTVVFIKKHFTSLSFHQQALKLLTIWPLIVQETTRCRRPTAFEVTPGARKLNLLGLTAGLLR